MFTLWETLWEHLTFPVAQELRSIGVPFLQRRKGGSEVLGFVQVTKLKELRSQP